MHKLLRILLLAIICISCKNTKKQKAESIVKTEYQEIINSQYHLFAPTKNIKKVVVLFGGFPETPEDIKREFKIRDLAKAKNIALLYMNYNQKLWLEKNQKQTLAKQLQNIFSENKLPTKETYIGGFSSGGNMAVLISAFLTQNKNFQIQPKGVFIVDSPIDLIALYRSSEKNIERNFSEPAIQESNWIIATLKENFGTPEANLPQYEKHAIYTSKTNTITNWKGLKNTKIRLYTEPDTLWWQENRKADYDQMNAYYIQKLSESLQNSGFNQVTYIPTENKGYRSNGERHPHSWSIIDKTDWIAWIIE
ncbi:hypothetical protein FG167_14310 [Lacinutrix sp. WUR7]|uniref:hypothetical protein n=1 Tax=Lacinutrix sp. WUR7 TaxID=2653681 RepID=UPI00193E511B|nr:hypothetical protein [Lacinutrix sp. WUR7]QRM90360.1 hypothetical protein FG167_14310 [Lacinutrix sp. WUR7]